MNRRQAIHLSGALVGSMFLLGKEAFGENPSGNKVTVISCQQRQYAGWPTLTQRKDGELLLVYSGGREAHVCPFGRVELIRSRDKGETWSWPTVVLDSPIDDRDAGVLETSKGTILVTTFTSLAFEPIMEKMTGWSQEKKKAWLGARDRISADERKKELGVWLIRSTDGGKSWSARIDPLVNSPHGPVQLSDGRVLYAGKELWKKPYRNGVSISEDDGQTWKWLAEIPTRPGDTPDEYHELHAVETSPGRIIVQIRNHNRKNPDELLQSESTDGGKTWSVPHSTDIWGLPSHLLKLKDGRCLMTYGYRRKPYGNQARISSDQGKTWSQPIIISDDGITGDLGYPSTVQLDEKNMLTVWYEVMKGSEYAVLRQAKWKLNS